MCKHVKGHLVALNDQVISVHRSIGRVEEVQL